MFLGDLLKGVSLSFIFNIWNLEQLEQPYFWSYLQTYMNLIEFCCGFAVCAPVLFSPACACARSWREVVQTSPQLHLTYVSRLS